MGSAQDAEVPTWPAVGAVTKAHALGNERIATLQEFDEIESTLARLDSMPVADHVAVYADLQVRLAAALAGTAGVTGPGDASSEQQSGAERYRASGSPPAGGG